MHCVELQSLNCGVYAECLQDYRANTQAKAGEFPVETFGGRQWKTEGDQREGGFTASSRVLVFLKLKKCSNLLHKNFHSVLMGFQLCQRSLVLPFMMEEEMGKTKGWWRRKGQSGRAGNWGLLTGWARIKDSKWPIFSVSSPWPFTPSPVKPSHTLQRA